jgi:uncharacterized GH25 family protein
MKKWRFIVSFLFVAFFYFLAEAHEFWLEPQKFVFQVGEKAIISFKVGENFMGETWDLKRHRVERLESYHLGKSVDYKTSVKEGEKGNVEIPLAEEGTHLVVMQSNNAFIKLDAKKFNEYLKEDGLDYIAAMRQKSNTQNDSSKEFYSRHAKLLLQAGGKTDNTHAKAIGLPIEIIPELNPYSLKKGDVNRYKVLFQGKPLFGVLVKVWNRYNNTTAIQNIYTEKDGTIEVRVSNSGVWMISAVKMVPSTEKGADWQSYWGSLVFGVN